MKVITTDSTVGRVNGNTEGWRVVQQFEEDVTGSFRGAPFCGLTTAVQHKEAHHSGLKNNV